MISCFTNVSCGFNSQYFHTISHITFFSDSHEEIKCSFPNIKYKTSILSNEKYYISELVFATELNYPSCFFDLLFDWLINCVFIGMLNNDYCCAQQNKVTGLRYHIMFVYKKTNTKKVLFEVCICMSACDKLCQTYEVQWMRKGNKYARKTNYCGNYHTYCTLCTASNGVCLYRV